MRRTTIVQRCLAELLGTFLLIFLGCGAVHVAVLTGGLSGLGQVGMVSGVAIMLAIYIFGGVSGAHINPAVTLALAFWRKFNWLHVAPYIFSQLAGAFLAPMVLFFLFFGFLHEKEQELKIIRGEPKSKITAMCYGEYFPNPAGNYTPAALSHPDEIVSEPAAVLAELLGTMILAIVIFALTDDRNQAAPLARLAPVFIGLTVTVLICVIAPITQACFNPARDFGPRLFAYFAGWGHVALPGPEPTGFLTVYILAPILGAILGGGVYLGVIRPALPELPAKANEAL
jgi:glycerol uptake facilitator protein